MIRRLGKNLGLHQGGAPAAAAQLERDGYVVLPQVFTPAEVAAMTAEVEALFATTEPDPRPRPDRAEFRYGGLNRSALTQWAIAHPSILATIEPLLGGDCHVIANTIWRNPPTFTGGAWHCDAGPHVPRPEGVPWDVRIPYPVFAIGAHLYLWDCPLVCGPPAVVPGSHRSGCLAPSDRLHDDDLTYDGRPPALLEARAGDVALFVSDAWHRGTPAGPGGFGRLFIQCHYGRRDIAQRILTTDEVHHLSPDAIARATTDRERTLIGLHGAYFYDG